MARFRQMGGYNIKTLTMKKFVLSLSIGLSAATFMVACNSNQGVAEQANAVKAADTTGLAEFQSAKQQMAYAEAAAFTAASASQAKTVYVPVRAASTAKRSASSTSKTASSSSTANKQVMQSQTENAAKTQKKGISKAAKGAIIGGVAGAAAGAISNKKNRVAGAVIGGVVGAAGGYGVGRGMDKKDGRYLTTHDFGGYVAQ
jgi:hypothetical protein